MRARSLGRREFIAVVGGAAAWPLTGHAQQPGRVRCVGVLMGFTENDPNTQAWLRAFAQALERLGWVEGKTIRIDYRFAAEDPTLFKTYAAELVGLSPDAILASTPPAVAALRQQSRTIPIVFVNVPDPVEQGFVQSLARPGGNLTGFSSFDASLMQKWLQLLKEVAPSVTRVAVISNPEIYSSDPRYSLAIEDAAPSLGVTVTFAPVHDDAAIEEAIGAQARAPGGGLISLPGNITHRDVIIAAATRHRLPLIGPPSFASAGGLMSYWYDAIDPYAQAASYIDRILRGANPTDLPVQQPTKYSLIINLETAKTLGLTVPPGMLDLADEGIE